MELRVLRIIFWLLPRQAALPRLPRPRTSLQPTLSRQIKELEDELGKELIRRGSRQTELTHEGLLPGSVPEEIVGLAERTKGISRPRYGNDQWRPEYRLWRKRFALLHYRRLKRPARHVSPDHQPFL